MCALSTVIVVGKKTLSPQATDAAPGDVIWLQKPTAIAGAASISEDDVIFALDIAPLLMTLTQRQRDVFEALFLKGWSEAETGERLKIARPVVSRHRDSIAHQFRKVFNGSE